MSRARPIGPALEGEWQLRRRGLCLAQARLPLPPVPVHQRGALYADGEAANDGGA